MMGGVPQLVGETSLGKIPYFLGKLTGFLKFGWLSLLLKAAELKI